MDKSTVQKKKPKKTKRAKQNVATACELSVKPKQYISLPFTNFP